jgi:hypothetical protein
MIQWVASPLNQGYSFLTRMSEIGQTKEEARGLLIAERIEDDPNLGILMILSARIVRTELTCRFVICVSRTYSSGEVNLVISYVGLARLEG